MKLHELSVEQCVALMNEEDRAVPDALDRARSSLVAFIEAAEPRFNRGGRLIYVGAGTSGRLGVLDAAEAPPTFQLPQNRIIGLIAGGDTALRRSSEGLEDDRAGAHHQLSKLDLTSDDIILGIAAGGTTPWVLGALEFAHACAEPAPLIGLLVCTPIESPAFVDHLLIIETGPEILTGSTRMKAGTATKIALNTISTTLMIRSGRVYENLMVDIRATNDKLRDRAARIIMTLTGLARSEAFGLLAEAGGAVKTAVLMQHRGLDRGSAESLLARHAGRLHKALADPGPT